MHKNTSIKKSDMIVHVGGVGGFVEVRLERDGARKEGKQLPVGLCSDTCAAITPCLVCRLHANLGPPRLPQITKLPILWP